MDDGMRLKQVEGPMVVHSNRSQSIHDNGLDKEYNRIVDTGGKLSSLQLIESVKWKEDFNSTSTLASNELYKQTITNSPPSQLRFLHPPSPVNSLADDEEGSFASPDVEESPSLSQSSDSDSLSEVHPPSSTSRRGIVNPNYPGFQHFASQLVTPSDESEDDRDTGTLDSVNSNNVSNNNNNNNDENYLDSQNHLNQLDTGGFQKPFYDKPKFNLPLDLDQSNFNKELDKVSYLVEELNIPVKELWSEKMVDVTEDLVVFKENNKMADAFLSGVKEEIQRCEDTNRAVEEQVKIVCEAEKMDVPRKKEKAVCEAEEMDVPRKKEKAVCETEEMDVPRKKEKTVSEAEEMDVPRKKEKAVCETEEMDVPRKKERMELNLSARKEKLQPANLAAQQPPANMTSRVPAYRRSSREKKKSSPEILGGFDVYNIETAMPTIDLDAIENHLKAAREEERRRRNDREEIRKRLATGCDGDEYYGGDRPGRKPSLQARLQSGMNLQICFMNDTMSDTESPSSDSEATAKVLTPVKQLSPLAAVPDTKLSPRSPRGGMSMPLKPEPLTEADFFAEQARLQADARLALAQAKDLARLQMEMERQRRQVSPITEMLKNTLLKVGVVFPEDRRRVSRQMLTDMNVAQLQVIVNDLHTQIEFLNESLVKLLMERDDLHMTQDSMLVDIEDLTRYLGAKENTFKEDISLNNNLPPTKPKQTRVAGRK